MSGEKTIKYNPLLDQLFVGFRVLVYSLWLKLSLSLYSLHHLMLKIDSVRFQFTHAVIAKSPDFLNKLGVG